MKIAEWGKNRVLHDPSFLNCQADAARVQREKGLAARKDIEDSLYLVAAVCLTGTDKRHAINYELTDDIAGFADSPEVRALLKPFVDEAMRRGGWEESE